MDQKPSIGRIVHAVFGRQCVAAIITAVTEDGVLLHVYPPHMADGQMEGAGHDEVDHHDGTWHWPERV